ncbi:MAG: metallophosphoesterase [Haloarculaceae archaeon]
MDATFDDRAALLGETLVIADLHVGRGPSSNLELPVGDGSDMLERVRTLLDRHEPAELVVAGDLLHSFETIPRTVRQTVDGIAAAAREAGARVVVTPGNHDTMLGSVWSGPTADEHRVDETVVLHGHRPPDTDADRYVLGHDHPTIEIEGQRRPCYLYGEGVYDGADVLLLPHFNRLIPGVVVNEMRADDFMSPLVRDVDSFRPIVPHREDEDTLTFPPLGEFREML